MQSTPDTKSAAKRKRAAKPSVTPNLGTLIEPTTVEELLEAVARTMFDEVQQPTLDNPNRTRLQRYASPWAGYESWHQGRGFLRHYETHATDGTPGFDPFNGSWNNSAQMSVAVDPIKTAIEDCTNMQDAVHTQGAKKAGDDMRGASAPKSPREAAARYFDVQPDDLMDLDVIKAKKLNEWARAQVAVRVFGGELNAGDACVVDFIDSGCGIAATEEAWRGSILSLNRENKRDVLLAIGKHGWGAAGAFQNADLSFLGSSVPGTDLVAFTIVEKSFRNSWDKVPTFQFLTINGKIPVVKRPEWWKWSTLVRHIGFRAPFTSLSGENSLISQLDRNLPEPVLPIWTEVVWMREGKLVGCKTLPGHRRHGRLLRGVMNKCRDSWKRTQEGKIETETEEAPGTETDEARNELSRVRYHEKYFIDLGDHDFGGREGVLPAGSVMAHLYVLDVKRDYTYKLYVNPKKACLFVLDGQTHGEHYTSLISSTSHGAGYSYVGKRAVLIVKCDSLTRESKFVLFGSSREQMRQNGLYTTVTKTLRERLMADTALKALDLEMAMESRKNLPIPTDKEFAEALNDYLEKRGMTFQTITQRRTRQILGWKDVERDVDDGLKKRKPPKPIPSKIPPTILRWALKRPMVKMWPGQKYSFVLETDAPEDWYTPEDPGNSRIQIMGTLVHFRGSDRPKGGRIRCYFELAAPCKVGRKGLIQAQLSFPRGEFAPLVAQLSVEVVEKPQPRTQDPTSNGKGKGGGKGRKRKEIVKVRVKRDQIEDAEVDMLPAIPIPLTEHETKWVELAWPRNRDTAAFSVRCDSGMACVYYNPENSALQEVRNALLKKHAGMEDRFDQLFRLKLVLEGIFCLNAGYYEEDSTEVREVQRVQMVNMATMRNLAMDVRTEIEQQIEVDTLRANTSP